MKCKNEIHFWGNEKHGVFHMKCTKMHFIFQMEYKHGMQKYIVRDWTWQQSPIVWTIIYPGDVLNPCATNGRNNWTELLGMIMRQEPSFVMKAMWEAREPGDSQDTDRWTRV